MRRMAINTDNFRPTTVYGASGLAVAGFLEFPGDIALNVLRYTGVSHLPQHPAGRPQLFVVLEGGGWVAGEDGQRQPIRAGEAVYWRNGDLHESGSEEGMVCLIVQAPGLEPPGRLPMEHPALLESLEPET